MEYIIILILYHLKVFYKLNLNIIYCNHFWQLKNFFTEFQLFQFAYLINSPIIQPIDQISIAALYGKFGLNNNSGQRYHLVTTYSVNVEVDSS